jgi:chorismate dehydratase
MCCIYAAKRVAAVDCCHWHCCWYPANKTCWFLKNKARTFAAAKITELEQTIKIGVVNYLNTKPLLYGIRHSLLPEQAELVSDYPANVAEALIAGRIDMGLVPVAIIPQLQEAHIITDYCIGCNGEVASVCLFSEAPLAEVETILLDYQSRTSVALLKILLKTYWKIRPQLAEGGEGFEKRIGGTTAGLVIGDRALVQRQHSKYQYDLGLAWKELTGLPFVFAAWVANKALPPAFVQQFNEANVLGLAHIAEVVAEEKYSAFDLQQYYTQYISYTLDGPKREAMRLFWEKME